MASFLITGATGFVGRALTTYLNAQGHQVTAASLNKKAVAPYTHLSLPFWRLQLDNLPASIDHVIHLAWAGSSGADRLNTDTQFLNVRLNEEAVALASHYNARFIGVGTITEDEIEATTFTPGVTPSSGFLYGVAKRAARDVSRFRSAEAGIEHIWVKLGNTYGLQDPTQRFLSSTLKTMLANGELNFTSGRQNYDFVYMDDVVRAFEAIALRGHTGETYYIGSGHAKPLRSYIEDLAAITGTASILNFGGAATAGVELPIEAFSILHTTEDTGWLPQTSFAVGATLLKNEAMEAAL